MAVVFRPFIAASGSRGVSGKIDCSCMVLVFRAVSARCAQGGFVSSYDVVSGGRGEVSYVVR